MKNAPPSLTQIENTPSRLPEAAPLESGQFDWARLRSGLFNYSLIFGVLLVWQIAGWLNLLPDYLLPPLSILKEFFSMAFSGELWPHVGASLFRSMSGFVLGSVLGLILGLLSGVSKPVETFWDPLISLTYPVPKVALLPVLLVWFGIGDASKIVVIALACFYPVFLNSYYGARSVNEGYIWAARNMGASRWRVFFGVIFPASLANIFAGIRIALALSFVVLFSAELLGSSEGLGFLVVKAEQGLRYDLMWVAIVSITILGFILDRVLLLVRRRVLAGQELAQYGEG